MKRAILILCLMMAGCQTSDVSSASTEDYATEVQPDAGESDLGCNPSMCANGCVTRCGTMPTWPYISCVKVCDNWPRPPINGRQADNSPVLGESADTANAPSVAKVKIEWRCVPWPLFPYVKCAYFDVCLLPLPERPADCNVAGIIAGMQADAAHLPVESGRVEWYPDVLGATLESRMDALRNVVSQTMLREHASPDDMRCDVGEDGGTSCSGAGYTCTLESGGFSCGKQIAQTYGELTCGKAFCPKERQVCGVGDTCGTRDLSCCIRWVCDPCTTPPPGGGGGTNAPT